jgi:Protein of unknown function (DUF2877)
MTARALFAGPGAMRALRPGRAGVVEMVLSRGAYVRFGDDWLALASPDAPFGPLSVAVTGLRLSSLRPGQPVRSERGWLRVGGHAVDVGRMGERRPAANTPATPMPAATPTAPRAVAAALAVVAGPPEELLPGLRALRRGRLNEGVWRLAGRGDGLTPAGDDALAGFAAWRHAAWRHAARATTPLTSLAAGRSSPLGHAYLRCAERGELPDTGAAVLAAVLAGDAQAAAAAAADLGVWGASSGAAMLWGIAAGADRLLLRTRPCEQLNHPVERARPAPLEAGVSAELVVADVEGVGEPGAVGRLVLGQPQVEEDAT